MKRNGAFAELLEKPMTRKQFIVHLGMMVFVLSGVSSILKILSDPQLVEKKGSQEVSKKPRFGNGTYGV